MLDRLIDWLVRQKLYRLNGRLIQDNTIFIYVGNEDVFYVFITIVLNVAALQHLIAHSIKYLQHIQDM